MNEVDELLLEHFGKRGMHWGVRSSSNRSKNQESRMKDRQKRNLEIDKARQKVESGKVKQDYKKAKDAHAANKEKLGSREARKILNKAKEKRYNDINNSRLAKSGKETAVAIAGTAAFAIAYTALRVAIDRG